MLITDVRYFYYRDDHRTPRITLCAVRADDGRIGYGWAICSYSDACVRDIGMFRARGRAMVALEKRGRGMPCCDWVGEGAQQYTQGVLGYVWRYARPVMRGEAKIVINACDDAAYGLYRLFEYGDVRGLPKAMRPEAFTPREEVDNASTSAE